MDTIDRILAFVISRRLKNQRVNRPHEMLEDDVVIEFIKSLKNDSEPSANSR